MKPIVCFEEVTKKYGGEAVLKLLNGEVYEGLTSFLGPSGCGKTTALRIIAGFEPIQKGQVWLFDELVNDASSRCVPPEKRRVGMVFQDFALFPHLNVEENLSFGLSGKASEIKERTRTLLRLVGMPGLSKRMPHELSGGQQQRVAIARSLAPRPRLLLLDESFSNCDPYLRSQIREEVKDVLKREGISVILVTHDRNEAFEFSERVVVLRNGAVVQSGTPIEIYRNPKDIWTAKFLGKVNLLPGLCAQGVVKTKIGSYLSEDTAAGQRNMLMVRPEDLLLKRVEGKHYDGTVISEQFLGERCSLKIELKCKTMITAEVKPDDCKQYWGKVNVTARRWQVFKQDFLGDPSQG